MGDLERRKRKHKAGSPVADATRQWLVEVSGALRELGAEVSDGEVAALADKAPRRWVAYEPMVLLPCGSFQSAPWAAFVAALSCEQVDALWQRILAEVSRHVARRHTHLAVNEGIPLLQDGQSAANVLRSPSGLRMLHGDFGPALGDFDGAFWVSTRQNAISQTWAPRWTMFSRGNVKEKARLLAFHGGEGAAGAELGHRAWPPARLRGTWAVDLYAGIGYFVFSYARLGMRVLCWELNPWSVEGLRRGALANGWSVRVVRGADLQRPTAQLVAASAEQIIVFLEDNREAAARIAAVRARGTELHVSHVNCGFLPTSQPTWTSAWDIAAGGDGAAWLHLHENVGARDIEARRAAVQAAVDLRNRAAGGGQRDVTVEHVERVKTFAPDVWHCVFDVYITCYVGANKENMIIT